MSIHDMSDDELAELDEVPEVVEPVKYVLGMDPGGTTGVAMLRYTDSTPPELIYLHQITDGHRGFWDFFGGARTNEFLTQVSEKWKEGGVKGANHTPLIIEGVQYAIWGDDIEYQGAELKSLVPDEWLREQNLWTPGKRHQMDALIHALVYLRNSGHKPTIEALSNRAEKPLAEEGEAKSKELADGDTETGEMSPDEAADMAEMMEALAQALKEAGEAAAEAAEAEADGEPAQGAQAGAGAGDPAGSDPDGGHYIDSNSLRIPEPEVKGTRNKRTRNGVFAGYDPVEDDGEVLFDGKL